MVLRAASVSLNEEVVVTACIGLGFTIERPRGHRIFAIEFGSGALVDDLPARGHHGATRPARARPRGELRPIRMEMKAFAETPPDRFGEIVYCLS